MVHALAEDQQDRDLLLLRQAPDLLQDFLGIDRCLRAVATLHFIHFRLRVIVSLFMPFHIDRRIDHQPVQPCGKGRLVFIGFQRPRQLDAGILGNILGVRPVAAPFERHLEHGRVMAIDQSFECPRVAARGFLHQL